MEKTQTGKGDFPQLAVTKEPLSVMSKTQIQLGNLQQFSSQKELSFHNNVLYCTITAFQW